jgi:hypothetical protein
MYYLSSASDLLTPIMTRCAGTFMEERRHGAGTTMSQQLFVDLPYRMREYMSVKNGGFHSLYSGQR